MTATTCRCNRRPAAPLATLPCPPTESLGRESAQVLEQSDLLSQRTAATTFVLCPSTTRSGSSSTFRASPEIHTRVLYSKMSSDREILVVRYFQNDSGIKERRCPSPAQAGGQYIRDYSTVPAGRGDVGARLYNGDGDWIATATYTAN